jgi:glycerophosphoryl diester phosphodiesterase
LKNDAPKRGRTSRKSRTAAVLAATAAAMCSLAAAPSASADTDPVVIAHRGDRAAAPENTNSAFRQAVSKGADIIELDVRFTYHGFPVVIHDATVDRTTNCTGAVNRHSRASLAKCDAGSWFGSKFRGERVPTLNSALGAIKKASSSTIVDIHISATPNAKNARYVMESLRKYGMMNRYIIAGNNDGALATMKRAGATELGLVFSYPAGWDKKYEHMFPYNQEVTESRAEKIHDRGGKIYPLETKPTSLLDLLDLFDDDDIDGIVIDNLTRLLGILG